MGEKGRLSADISAGSMLGFAPWPAPLERALRKWHSLPTFDQ
jgi:hypothetical protein